MNCLKVNTKYHFMTPFPHGVCLLVQLKNSFHTASAGIAI